MLNNDNTKDILDGLREPIWKIKTDNPETEVHHGHVSKAFIKEVITVEFIVDIIRDEAKRQSAYWGETDHICNFPIKNLSIRVEEAILKKLGVSDMDSIKGHKVIDAEKLNEFLKKYIKDSFYRNALAYKIAEHEDEILKSNH